MISPLASARVRKAIEAEFGALSDVDYRGILGMAILTMAPRNPAPAERPLREPTRHANIDAITKQYPKTIEAIARELSVYSLKGKSDGTPVQAQWRFGIAIAIIDHILKAGELS